MNPGGTLLDLANRRLRSRATAWLLIGGFLLGQFALYLHHLEHELHEDTGSCALCLIAHHVGAAPLVGNAPLVAATGHDAVIRYLLPSVTRPSLHVFRARAPPVPLPD